MSSFYNALTLDRIPRKQFEQIAVPEVKRELPSGKAYYAKTFTLGDVLFSVFCDEPPPSAAEKENDE